MADVFRVTVTVAPVYADAFASALEPHCDAVSWNADEDKPTEEVRVLGFASGPPDEAKLARAVQAAAEACGIAAPDFTVEQLPLTNWVTANLEDFAPFAVGRFFIYGADFEGAVPAGKIGLRVPPGAAFGSGQHGTTQGCLLALEDLARRRRFASVLDVGCGSGILAIAAAKLWAAPVVALDIDPIAARHTRRNARDNGVGPLITTGCAVGYRARLIHRRRFELICANILARPLIRMAGDLAAHLAPGGVAVLSGLLESDGNRVLAAHRARGLKLAGRIDIDGWRTLVLERRL